LAVALTAAGPASSEAPPAAAHDPGLAIAAYVAEQLGVDASEVHVRTLSPMAAETTGAGRSIVAVREARPGSLLGRTAFVVRTSADGRSEASTVLSAEVQRVGRIVVAARQLPRLHRLTDADLAVRSAGLGDVPDTATSSADMLIGKRLTRSIAKDRPVTLDAVDDAPVVQRGDRVTLRMQQGNLTILAVGRAKEDGRVGRQIPVANEDSRKVVYGRVIDASTVAVETAP
jgi:flagella basal body P-ring formation protein FlgA